LKVGVIGRGGINNILKGEVAKKIAPIHNEIENIRQRAIADTEEVIGKDICEIMIE